MLRILVLISVVILLSGCETLPPDNPAGMIPQASNEAGTHAASGAASSKLGEPCEPAACFENILNSADRAEAMDAWLDSDLSIDELKIFMKDKENLLTIGEKKKIMEEYIDIKTNYSNDILTILETVTELGLDAEDSYDYKNFIELVNPSIRRILIDNQYRKSMGRYGQNQFEAGIYYTSGFIWNRTLGDTIARLSEKEDVIILFDILATQIQRESTFEKDEFTIVSVKYLVIKYYIIDQQNQKWIAGVMRKEVVRKEFLGKDAENHRDFANEVHNFENKPKSINAWNVIDDGELDNTWSELYYVSDENETIDWKRFQKRSDRQVPGPSDHLFQSTGSGMCEGGS